MPTHIELTPEEKKELGSYIEDSWGEDNADRQRWLDDLPRWLDAYQGRVKVKNTPWEGASNLHVPVTATVVDAIHPRIMAAAYRPDPVVHFEPEEPADNDKARKREKFLDWAVREEVKLFPVLDRVALSMLINGVAFTKQEWELKTRHLRDKHRFPKDTPLDKVFAALMQGDVKLLEAVSRVEGTDSLEGIFRDGSKERIKVEFVDDPRDLVVFTEREEVIRDAPLVRLLNPEDVAVNVDSPFDLEEADHIFHRYWLTFDQIKRKARHGTFKLTEKELDDLEKLLSREIEASDDSTSTVKQARDDITGTDTMDRSGPPDKAELIDAYLPWDINDDGYDEEVVVTICRQKPSLILRCHRLEEVYRHGRRPIIAWPLLPVNDSFWSIGMPQRIDGLQQEINTIHNQRVDSGEINNRPWGWYVPAAGANPERMPIEPGFLNPVDDINGVKMHQPGNYAAWGFEEEKLLWDLIEKLTKVSDLTLGRVGDTQGAARTATGVQALSNQQATGFDIFIRRFQEPLKLCLQHLLKLYAQYVPPGKEKRILGRGAEPDIVISREDLQTEMDMRFTGNSLNTDRDVERQVVGMLTQGPLSPQSLTFYGQLGVISPQSVAEVLRHTLEVFDWPDVDRIVTMPPTPALSRPDDVVSKVLGGERVVPRPGEDHAGVMQGLMKMLQGPDSIGLSPEVMILAQEQIQWRQQAQQQEMMMAMQAQAQAMMQAQMQPQQGQPAQPGQPQQRPQQPQQPQQPAGPPQGGRIVPGPVPGPIGR